MIMYQRCEASLFKIAAMSALLIFTTQVKAITQAELDKQNADAEKVCDANRQFGSLSGNDMLKQASAVNYKFFWGVILDTGSYQLCKNLAPKNLAKLAVQVTPDLAKRINDIINGTQSDAEKGQNIQILFQESMSPESGYATNNNTASIRVAPTLGIAKLTWDDIYQVRQCEAYSIGAGFNDNGTPTSGSLTYTKYTDTIYPSHQIYRVVNGVDHYLATINGNILSTTNEYSISALSASSAIKNISKELVVDYVKRLRDKDNSEALKLNVFYDYNAGIQNGVPINYKIVSIDPEKPRTCTTKPKYYTASYILNYDINADGIPDFVNANWYRSEIGKVYAPHIVPVISYLLL